MKKNKEENVQLLYFKSFGHTNYITGFLCFLSGRIYKSPLQETHICEVSHRIGLWNRGIRNPTYDYSVLLLIVPTITAR